MKFCDKLQKLRKENNITQEQLADKLNVSRQAVSKWESGQAYPDMDKMIALTNIFNVTMDELINDRGSKKEKENQKISFMEVFEKTLAFISKSVNMFWAMKFKEKIKFLFEMIVLVMLLSVASYFVTSVIGNFITQLFRFLPENILSSMDALVDSFLYLGCVVFGIIIVVRVLKTRYLDYYIIVNDDSVNEKVKESPIPELKEHRDYKVVIRDPEHSISGVFQKIGRFFLFLLKCFCILVALPMMFTFVCCVVLFVISLFYTGYGMFFNGISIAILGGITMMFLLIEFMYNLVFNRKHNFGRMFLLLIASLSLMGIGSGLSVNALASFDYSDNSTDNYVTDAHIIEMDDNLVIREISNLPDESFVIDDTKNDIKLDIATCKDCKLNIYSYQTLDTENKAFKLIDVNYNCDDVNEIKKLLSALKNKKVIWMDNDPYKIEKVYISTDNLTKLRNNLLKYNEE